MRIQILILGFKGLRASSHEPDYRDECHLWFLKRKGQRSWRRVLVPNSRNKNLISITFAPIIASATLKAVSEQLNGMLVMWKIQQAMQDDAIRTARTHPAFIPVTCLKCSYGKISSPLTEISVGKNEISGTEPACPLI